MSNHDKKGNRTPPTQPDPAPLVQPPKAPPPAFDSAHEPEHLPLPPDAPKTVQVPTVAPVPVVVVAPVPEPTPPVPNPPTVRAPELPVPSAPLPGHLTPEREIAELEKRIASDQARIHLLLHPVIEFPKWVNGILFNTRAAQDAAGPDYRDKDIKDPKGDKPSDPAPRLNAGRPTFFGGGLSEQLASKDKEAKK